MTIDELRAILEEETIDATLWVSNDKELRRMSPVLVIDESGYCSGVLDDGQPVSDYCEQIVGARLALHLLDGTRWRVPDWPWSPEGPNLWKLDGT